MKKVQLFISKLIKLDWLYMCHNLNDLEIILDQMDYKTKFGSKLSLSINDLKENYSFYEKSFFTLINDVVSHSNKEILKFINEY